VFYDRGKWDKTTIAIYLGEVGVLDIKNDILSGFLVNGADGFPEKNLTDGIVMDITFPTSTVIQPYVKSKLVINFTNLGGIMNPGKMRLEIQKIYTESNAEINGLPATINITK